MATGLGGKDDVNVGFGASVDGLMRGIGDAVRGVAAGSQAMQGSLKGIAAASSVAVTAIKGLALAAAGGALFKDALQETMKFGHEVGNLSRRFDLTAKDASILSIAIDDAYLSVDEFNGSASQLNRQLRSNEDGLKSLGVATRDQNGNYVDQKTLMFNTLSALREYKSGTDQNLAATVAFGRGMDEQMLQKLFAVQEGYKKTSEEGDAFGRILGTENVQAAREFRQAMKDAGDGTQGLQMAVGNGLMPSFTSLLNIFRDAAISAIPIVSAAFKTLGTVIIILSSTVYNIWQLFKGLVQTIAVGLIGAIDIVVGLFENGFSGVPDKIKNVTAGVEGAWTDALANIAANNVATKNAIDKTWADPGASGDAKVGPEAGGRSGGKGFKAFDKNGAKDQLEQMKAEFKLLQTSQGDYIELTKQQEVEFWAARKDIFKRGTKEWLEVNAMYYAARRAAAAEGVEIEKERATEEATVAGNDAARKVQIAENWLARMEFLYTRDSKQYREAQRAKLDADREYAQQQRQFSDIKAAAFMAESQTMLDIAGEQARALASIGAISRDEAIAIERDLIASKYQLALEDIERRRGLFTDDLLMQQQLNAEKVRLDSELQKALAQNTEQQQGAIYDSWSNMLDGMFSTLANVTQGLLQRTMTWRQAMQNVTQSLLGSFVSLGVQRTRDWVLSELTMSSASKAGNAVRTAAAVTGASATMSAKATEATAVVAGNAAEAASGAAASQASIPYVGPILAVAAAAAILAFVMGLAGGGGGSSQQSAQIPSAAGGWWDIPRDTMALVHAKEMVMPADLAEGVRNAVEGNSPGVGGFRPTFQINAVDGQSVERLFRNHGDKMVSAMKDQYRNNPRTRN